MTIAKAKLKVVAQGDTNLEVEVHFNPQNLRVNYRTFGSSGARGAGTNYGQQAVALQQTGYLADLTMELLFDTSQSGVDVRNTTLLIVAMAQPAKNNTSNDGKQPPAVPLVLFSWGTFLFTGSIQSMSETLDFFSEQGTPLRATVNLSMASLELDRVGASGANSSAGIGFGAGISAGLGFSAGIGVGVSASAGFSAGAAIGTAPLTLAQDGDTLQRLAGRTGVTASWQAVASANNIDNPRLVQPGTILNLNAHAEANL